MKLIHVNNLKPADVENKHYYKSSFNAGIFEGRDFNIHNFTSKELIRELNKYNITEVVPGSESAVRVSDKISEQLGVRTNGTRGSEARRDKYKMHKKVERKAREHQLKNGLKKPVVRTIKQEVVTTREQLEKWAKEHNKWPIAIKELDGAGGKNFFEAHNMEQAISAFNQIMKHSSVSLEGKQNTAVLVGEFIKGATEYVSNTIGVNGKHIVTEQWVYKKVNNGPYLVYDRMALIPRRGEVESRLAEAHLFVVEALGIKNHASHGEYFVTSSGEIILVEVGARLMGSMAHDYSDLALGKRKNQISRLADALASPKKFLEGRGRDYKVDGAYEWIGLINNKEGVTLTEKGVEKIRSLESFVEGTFGQFLGKELPITKDLYTMPGNFLLYNKNPKALERDYRLVREWEANGELYETLN